MSVDSAYNKEGVSLSPSGQQQIIIDAAARFVRELLEQEQSGHDWWHAYRVWKLTQRIGAAEGGDTFVCELSALLHDVADDKVDMPGANRAALEAWLAAHTPADVAARVLDIIATMSFRGGHGAPVQTLEGRIVQDADRLDAMGAIGIARTFAYAGAKGQIIHHPELAPRAHMTFVEYRHGQATAINHFPEKLLKLRDLMNTATARALAEERHRVLEEFLHEFLCEWEGER